MSNLARKIEKNQKKTKMKNFFKKVNTPEKLTEFVEDVNYRTIQKEKEKMEDR